MRVRTASSTVVGSSRRERATVLRVDHEDRVSARGHAGSDYRHYRHALAFGEHRHECLVFDLVQAPAELGSLASVPQR